MPEMGNEIEFPNGVDSIRGYLARPQDATGEAGLIVIPDVRGLYSHFRDVADRYAAEGFTTLAIDPYSREGTPDLPDMDAVFAWLRALPDGRILEDVEAARHFLETDENGNWRRVGVTGYCMGGQYALMAACTNPRLAACVSWYGMLRYEQTSPHKPRSPLDLAPSLACPYLGLFGEDDQLIPRTDVAELRSILDDADKEFAVHSYPGAGHACATDSRPETFRRDAAADAWAKAIPFLRRHLHAG